MNKHYDIIIVGGGMVGASLACALIQAGKALGLSIAVVEGQPLPSADELSYQPSFDERSTALAYGSRSIYEAMGIWEMLAPHLAAIEQIHVSDKGRFGVTRLHAEQERVPALGYVVENRRLGYTLLERLQYEDAQHIEFICPANVTDLRYIGTQVEVDVKQAEQTASVSADLVVMADGGRSELRQKLGVSYTETAYQQHAIIANISLDRSHQGVAYERFTDTGPMALLPLRPHQGCDRAALVWTVADDQLDEVLALSDDAFLERLHERFGYRAGNFTQVGSRQSYPLKLTIANEQVRQGLVVLGNAAHALHPIAGQGYNLALRGVAALAETLVQAKRQNIGVGDLSSLQGFYNQQLADQERTIMFSDQTMKLFSNAHPMLGLGRSAGLQLLDVCSPLRTLFARSAMGLDSATPNLR